jgi:thiol-disulfide isomerase/thioredoxin
MKKVIIWILILLLLVAVIIGASFLYKNLSEKYNTDRLDDSGVSSDADEFAAPDFTVFDENGKEVKLSDFKGKPVVINFWATWCYYCKEEMPDFNKAYKNYPDVQFLMINATDGVQETKEKAKSYVEEEKFDFDVFYDTKLSAVNAYYVSSFPSTYFVDKNGNLVTGANGMIDYETLERGIKMITE